jgi:hypothetical protein
MQQWFNRAMVVIFILCMTPVSFFFGWLVQLIHHPDDEGSKLL